MNLNKHLRIKNKVTGAVLSAFSPFAKEQKREYSLNCIP
jgi:hypothetical protein